MQLQMRTVLTVIVILAKLNKLKLVDANTGKLVSGIKVSGLHAHVEFGFAGQLMV